MTQTTFTDNVVVQGSQDTTQLAVQGNGSQTAPLQTWQDSTPNPLARIAANGRMQTGDLNAGLGTQDAFVEANASFDTLPASKPQRGIQSLGRFNLGTVLANALVWASHELELLGNAGVSGLQTAIRGKITHNNSGSSGSADLRGGDFQAINQTGSVGMPVGKATGVRGTGSNLPATGNAYLTKAIGVEASVTNDAGGTITDASAFEVAPPTNAGTITSLYGVRVPTLNPGGTVGNYAAAQFGDEVELPVLGATPLRTPPSSFIKVYPKLSGGAPHLYAKDAAGIEYDLSSGAAVTTPFDVTGTAGETLAARDAVYLNPTDSKWYKLDTDATASVKVGEFRGFASATITSNTTGSIRLAGALTGFSSLTIGANVWASTTPGAITQTKPTISAGGGQRAIIRLGYASAADTVIVEAAPVKFQKRESLANNASLTIEHYADASARERRVRAYISSTVGGTLTSYQTGQDQDRGLRAGSGGTLTITGSINSSLEIGTAGGSQRAGAQSFTPTAGGDLTQFTVTLTTNTGAPTGTITWYIKTGSAGSGGTVLATGSFTPTANATNTINVSNGPFLDTATTYYLGLISTSVQANNNHWNWSANSANPYAGGDGFVSLDNGASFSSASRDMLCAFTTVTLDRIAQSFQIGSTDTCDYVTLFLKKVGSPGGTLTLRIETDSAGAPSGTLVHANATITVAESALSTSYSNITFNFTNFALSSGVTYWLVLSTDRSASDTNYVLWGVDASSPGYASGNLSTYASGAYTADTSRDAIFSVIGPTTSFESPKLVDDWSSSLAVVLARFDDGAGANSDINTTLKNATGATLDVTCVVEMQ